MRACLSRSSSSVAFGVSDRIMKKAPLSMLIAGLGGLAVGLLFRFRFFPFLQTDTMMNHGKQVSTAQFAASTSRFFFAFACVCIFGAVIWMFMLAKKR